MMHRIAIAFAMACVGFLHVACDSNVSQNAGSTAPWSGAAPGIADRISGYLDALQRGDVNAAAEYWTDDARLLAPGADLSRSTVLDGMRSVFDAGTRVEVVDRTTLELFEHGDIAYEIATAEEVFVSADAAQQDTVRNRMFIRWERGSDGEWRFDRVVLAPLAQSRDSP